MNIVLTAGQLAAGYCWSGPQQYLNDIIAVITASITGQFTGINFGVDTPSAQDQDKPWFRLNADGTPDRVYTFMGQWLARHPVPPSSGYNMIWDDSEDALWEFDGGHGNPDAGVSDVSGPMWIRNTNFDFKFPFGMGTNTVKYDTSDYTTIAQGATGGEERVLQTLDTLVAHAHPCKKDNLGTGVGGTSVLQDDTSVSTAVGNTENQGGGLSANNMPPYRGVLFARRSSRIFYTTTI